MAIGPFWPQTAASQRKRCAWALRQSFVNQFYFNRSLVSLYIVPKIDVPSCKSVSMLQSLPARSVDKSLPEQKEYFNICSNTFKSQNSNPVTDVLGPATNGQLLASLSSTASVHNGVTPTTGTRIRPLSYASSISLLSTNDRRLAMCTAIFAFGVHPTLLFFLAFNRDEFFDRYNLEQQLHRSSHQKSSIGFMLTTSFLSADLRLLRLGGTMSQRSWPDETSSGAGPGSG